MRTIFPILLLFLACLPLYAEDDTVSIDLSAVDLPDRAERTIAEMHADLDELERQYLAAVEEIKSDAIKDLERDRKRERDQLVALALQAEIEKIQEMEAPLNFMGLPIRNGPSVSGVMRLTWGRGADETTLIRFNADGTATPLTDDGAVKHDDYMASWTIEDNTLNLMGHNKALTCSMKWDEDGSWSQTPDLQRGNHFTKLNYSLDPINE